MNNFVFYAPTKVVFGKNSEAEVGTLVKEQGAKKVLVHFGGESAKKSGLLATVTDSLEEAGIGYVCLGGVVPNPRLSLVYEGARLCKQEGVDFILAVGGGSVIDSSKAIGYALCHEFDVWDIYDWKQKPTGCMPVGCVLTIAAAGSEMSDSSVITNDTGGIKRGINSPYCRCKFAILNPELTYTLPEYQTACGVVDILMHTMERYFVKDNTLCMTDGIAEALMRTVIENGRILITDPQNYEARAEIMWAGSLSHNGLTGCGTGGDWATHQLEHELSGLFDVAHGAGLSAVWATWARYVYGEKPERFVQFAKNVFGIEGENAALKGIVAAEAFFKELNMPTSLTGLLGFSPTIEKIEEMTVKCAHHDRCIGSFKTLAKDDIRAIYLAAK